MSEIVLGCLVIDTVSGVEGIVTARAEWLNGCLQYCIQPKTHGDGTPRDARWADAAYVTYAGVGVGG